MHQRDKTKKFPHLDLKFSISLRVNLSLFILTRSGYNMYPCSHFCPGMKTWLFLFFLVKIIDIGIDCKQLDLKESSEGFFRRSNLQVILNSSQSVSICRDFPVTKHKIQYKNLMSYNWSLKVTNLSDVVHFSLFTSLCCLGLCVLCDVFLKTHFFYSWTYSFICLKLFNLFCCFFLYIFCVHRLMNHVYTIC